MLPLQSTNNVVIPIKRLQTHLAVDCYQVQVDVLSPKCKLNYVNYSRDYVNTYFTRVGIMSQKSMREIIDLPGGGEKTACCTPFLLKSVQFLFQSARVQTMTLQ